METCFLTSPAGPQPCTQAGLSAASAGSTLLPGCVSPPELQPTLDLELRANEVQSWCASARGKGGEAGPRGGGQRGIKELFNIPVCHLEGPPASGGPAAQWEGAYCPETGLGTDQISSQGEDEAA